MSMRHFRILTRIDRIKIETMLNTGHSVREIADFLGFHRSSIYREIKRGKYEHLRSDYQTEFRYSSDLAQEDREYKKAATGRNVKIGYDRELANFLEHLILEEDLSPEAALFYIKKNSIRFDTTISVRTVYRYIDHGIFLRLTNKNLPVKGRKGRKCHVERVQKRASVGKSIERRPQEVLSRNNFGHWEMDTVKGKQKVTKGCLLVLTERKTRSELIFKLKDQKSGSVVQAIDQLEQKLGDQFTNIFQTITVDNGVEFSDYKGIERSVLHMGKKRTELYYCHAYCSWERPSNENQNKLIRRKIPKGFDIDQVTDKQVVEINQWINLYPRGIFDGYNASDMWDKEIPNLKLEKII